MGFVLETHSRPWVPDLILHLVAAFKHCSSSFEGEEKFPTFPFLGLVPPRDRGTPRAKGWVLSPHPLGTP